MPRLEPKIIQRELEQGQIWPVYWIHGQERMKARELLKRIRRAVLGEEDRSSSLLGLAEETFDGGAASSDSIVEAAQSPSLGGGVRMIVVRDAHAIKSPEAMASLLGPKAEKAKLASVCVFLSKDLDGRKKFSKLLLEQAAVVACEEVPEAEREAWVGYLAKRRGLKLSAGASLQLSTLDPWTLDIVDQELEKVSISEEGGSSAEDALLAGNAGSGGSEAFLDAFFKRELAGALRCAEAFADRPEESLPLLGLLGWNARHLVLSLGGKAKLNPYVAARFQSWCPKWSMGDALRLQERLAAVDFGLKQTPLLPLGIWVELILEFCR